VVVVQLGARYHIQKRSIVAGHRAIAVWTTHPTDRLCCLVIAVKNSGFAIAPTRLKVNF